LATHPPARIATTMPMPEPCVLVMAGDSPISVISEVSGFPLLSDQPPQFRPPAAVSGLLSPKYLFLQMKSHKGKDREEAVEEQ
jgi:hypothetical protein